MSVLEEPQPMATLAVRRVLSARSAPPSSGEEPIKLILETRDPKKVERYLQKLRKNESAEKLSDGFYSLRVDLQRARDLVGVEEITRLQTKKPSKQHLEAALPESGVLNSAGARTVAETGRGVMIGIVDSGFDLSHPMFRDGNGTLRVDALLDQTTGREFTTAQLQQGWANGTNPGADQNGHGTHVASIAGGTRFGTREGVAPEARFLLVKTNFIDTDLAVSWIFQKAGARPCVINMSLGHHFGAHDGTDAEERLHDQITGAGKILVISAGNEANDQLHLGSRFSTNQARGVLFDFLRPRPGDFPGAALTIWYDRQDQFSFNVVTPTGSVLQVPAAGSPGQTFSGSQIQVKVSRSLYPFNNLVQAQIVVSFQQMAPQSHKMKGWGLNMRCNQAVIGRMDAWFANSGMAVFRSNAMVEAARTVGLAATGNSCISVASYVSKTSFEADNGPEVDSRSVVGRISSFSSIGPSRDGREKPDIAAPGQYLTAALAAGSNESEDEDAANNAQRLLTIAGTSMAAPMVTGVVALMLQKRGTLTPQQAKQALFASARKDAHTGLLVFTTQYGHGKVDAAGALAQI
jgi:subtilisin family serine protease